MRNFGPTNTHGTASAPMQWLYQKEATGMESSKRYCPSRCRYRTYQCGAANYPRVMGSSKGSTKEICEISGLPIPMVPRLHQCNGYIKRKLRAWRVQKCIALVGEDIALTSAGRKLPRVMGAVQGPPRKYAKLRAYQYPWYRVCTNAMVI